jgi:hypothetical protein
MATTFHPQPGPAPGDETAQIRHGPAPDRGVEWAVRVAGGLPTQGGGAAVDRGVAVGGRVAVDGGAAGEVLSVGAIAIVSPGGVQCAGSRV